MTTIIIIINNNIIIDVSSTMPGVLLGIIHSNPKVQLAAGNTQAMPRHHVRSWNRIYLDHGARRPGGFGYRLFDPGDYHHLLLHDVTCF
jgi:hypothetical protein